jgi:ferredoxin
VRVRIDSGRCMGYMVCSTEFPDVFKLDDKGYAFVESNEVSPEEEQQVRDAATSCPALAILVED